jgi:anti-sigma-K factor RskA
MVMQGHVVELLPGYALGCLDEEEEKQVLDHLAACAQCLDELQGFQEVVTQLPAAMKMADPPPELKAKIMGRVAPAGVPMTGERKASAWERFLATMRQSAPAWGVVGLLLILILGVGNLFQWQRLNAIESASQAMLETIPMSGTEYRPNATGLLVVSRDGKRGALVVDGLMDLSDDQEYQLWLIRDGQRTDGGTFSVNETGYGILWVRSDEPLDSFPEFDVTIEPEGGSPQPTGDKVLGGEQ